MSPRTLSVRLNNRLGNQLFEYAFARALSLRLGINHCILVGSAPNRLDCFHLPSGFRFASRVGHLSWIARAVLTCMGKLAQVYASRPALLFRIESALRWLVNLCGVHFCLDGYLCPHYALLRSCHLYCSGYFQSERYFKDYSSVIRSDLAFLESVTSPCCEMADLIKGCQSVCIHIRMGDYRQLPAYSVCDRAYFLRAIAYVKRKMPDAIFFLFSDDPAQASALLSQPEVRVIPSHFTDQQSLYLGSLCRHHIISNSSFSWWMQYLAYHKDQIVIAPQRWMNDDTPTPQYQAHWTLV